MMLEFTNQFTTPAALSLLPNRMSSDPARAMLIAIGLQESRFEHRVQIRGPARGFWQFEQAGGVAGVLSHRTTRTHAKAACEALRYDPEMAGVYRALADNDVLAAVFARLLLWSHPDALPLREEPNRAWQYYLDTWRPGRPHRATWNEFYERAWATVSP